MSDESSSGYRANLQRGELLRGQGRYADAEKFLQAAIAEEPSQAEGYYELALCYCNWPGHGKKALATVDHAISLDPNHSEFYSLRAWILGNLDRHQESLRVAGQALNMNPYSLLALNAQTRTYIDLHEWVQAEESARRTLATYTLNETAANLLAIALRQQGRLEESNAVTARLLATMPWPKATPAGPHCKPAIIVAPTSISWRPCASNPTTTTRGSGCSIPSIRAFGFTGSISNLSLG